MVRRTLQLVQQQAEKVGLDRDGLAALTVRPAPHQHRSQIGSANLLLRYAHCAQVLLDRLQRAVTGAGRFG